MPHTPVFSWDSKRPMLIIMQDIDGRNMQIGTCADILKAASVLKKAATVYFGTQHTINYTDLEARARTGERIFFLKDHREGR